MKILLVDPELPNFRAIRFPLEHGQAVAVCSAEKAHQLLRKETFDLLVSTTPLRDLNTLLIPTGVDPEEFIEQLAAGQFSS